MVVQKSFYLRLILSGFHEGANLISFCLAEVVVSHKQLSLLGHEALNANHAKPTKHQLLKVAFLLCIRLMIFTKIKTNLWELNQKL